MCTQAITRSTKRGELATSKPGVTGRVLSRPHKTRYGSKRAKSSSSLKTKQRMSNGEEVEKEGEDEVEEEPRTVRKSKKGAATARGGRRGRGDAVLEEVDTPARC